MVSSKIILPEARSNLSKDWIDQYRQNRWMNLGDTSKIEIVNPFYSRTQQDIENPHVFLLDLMRRPENFGFTVKTVFGKTLAPFQLAILRELWIRPFPMLLGSRGMGKCVRGDTLIQTNHGIVRIDELTQNADEMEQIRHPGLKVFGEHGFRDVAYAWNNGFTRTVRIRTRQGYELEGTRNHPVRVVGSAGVVWKDLGDVTADEVVIIDRTESWHEETTECPDDLAYLLGLVAGDGGFTKRGNITFTTADEELLVSANAIAMKYWRKEFRDVPSSKYSYGLYSTEIWEQLFTEYGFPSSECAKKGFPRCVLTGPKSACAAFIRGLFDTDGGVEKAGCVSLSAKSECLVRTLQFVLTRFGIVSKRRSKLNKKYNRLYWHLTITGADARRFAKKIGFGLSRKRKSLSTLISRRTNTNRDIIPSALVLDDTLALSVASRRRRGDGKRPGRLSPNRLRAYGCTYEALNRLLIEGAAHEEMEAHRRLSRVKATNYYYDTVVAVDESECITYDVHVPDGNSFVSNGLVSHNSWILALYCMLRSLFNQGSKIVIVGAAFRQAKVVFDYCQELWEKAPVLRSIVGDDKRNGPRRDVDRVSLRMGDSIIVGLPLGDGSKIRGQRANIIVADEFASISKEIFETVVRGFTAVSLNPVEEFQREMQRVALKELGLWTEAHDALEEESLTSNQTIISGTAYYSFNHYYEYWRQYKAIVESRGDERKLAEVFNGEIPERFNWKDYSVIRIPADRLPPKFMDQKQIAQAKATVHYGTFCMEYGAVFATDSQGFYKRSLIESCVVGKPDNAIEQPSCGLVRFEAMLRGVPGRKYVMAVDPASERDNLSIAILEMWPDHRRIVHCWTTTRKKYKALVKRGLTRETEYYRFAARQVRRLNSMFPCVRIGIDSEGGGVALMEALQDILALEEGEVPILPVIDPDNPQDTDGISGDHIIEVIHFAKADWVRDANHGMRKDLEDKALLFPAFDPALVALAWEEDKAAGRVKVDPTDSSVEKLYDTLEDVYLEIEDLKDELTTIIHTQTERSLRDRWDTPETKQAGGKKGRLRKDRYSSLLMANMIARTLHRAPKEAEYKARGGWAKTLGQGAGAKTQGRMWVGAGPEGSWWAENAGAGYGGGGAYGAVVKRGG